MMRVLRKSGDHGRQPALRVRAVPAPMLLVFAAVCLLPATGCALLTAPVGAASGPAGFINEQVQYNETTDSLILGWRNSVWSNKAWIQQRHLFADHPYAHVIGKGFKAGYMDVAGGGEGCPPVLPPREYWSWRYQSPEGQAKTAAWFEGYPVGAAAAEKDGIANWDDIQTAYNSNSKSIRGRAAFKEFLEQQQHRVPAEEVPADREGMAPGFDQAPIPVLPRRNRSKDILPEPSAKPESNEPGDGAPSTEELPGGQPAIEKKATLKFDVIKPAQATSAWKPRPTADKAATASATTIRPVKDGWMAAREEERGDDGIADTAEREVGDSGVRASDQATADKSQVVPASATIVTNHKSKKMAPLKLTPAQGWRGRAESEPVSNESDGTSP